MRPFPGSGKGRGSASPWRPMGRHAVLGALTALVLTMAANTVAAADPVSVDAEFIAQFDKGSKETRFGSLVFLGGLELSASDGRFAGFSAIRLDEDGERFLAVSDTGNWLAGRIERDKEGRPRGIADAEMARIIGLNGQPVPGKAAGDAESLAIADGKAFVGFEHLHRIFAFPLNGLYDGRPTNVPLPIPRRELRANEALETLAAAPPGSPLAGRLVAIAENSIDPAGNIFASIFSPEGGEAGIFKVRRDEGWAVSDGDFLPDGDLLVLERRFQAWFGGLGIRIRRIAGDTIRPGALVDGAVVFEVWQDEAGRMRLTLISDDNNSIFQRNLLLEFCLQ